MSGATPRACVIGAGLAGCEAAWQLARRGVEVTLWEQKPLRRSAAHHGNGLAELVCSNSLGSDRMGTAPGLLKAELRQLGSLILSCADAARVEAGGALAVDREAFSARVTAAVEGHPRIRLLREECAAIPAEGDVIIATGPLTEGALAADIARVLGMENLCFYDASAPLVTTESIDMERAFFASRWDKGSADYINCPMDEAEYRAFWEALVEAEGALVHGFEENRVFEGCMPVEVMAKRGFQTLAYGPLRPVGLRDPRTGQMPYAVVQLRRDNRAGTLYNLVGFQTHLKFGEQRRVFSMIPALSRAEFARYGVMHRNSFIQSPRLLDQNYALRSLRRLRFAGQLTGVEGYVESTSSGLAAGLSLACRLYGLPEPDFTTGTAVGALAHYISGQTTAPGTAEFQPMNINFGILDTPAVKYKGKQDKKEKQCAQALRTLTEIQGALEAGWPEAYPGESGTPS